MRYCYALLLRCLLLRVGRMSYADLLSDSMSGRGLKSGG